MFSRSVSLFSELLSKLAISFTIFTALVGVCLCLENVSGLTILKWEDLSFVVSIPASICGVAYILIIKNSHNYYGFYLGILMAILLAIQYQLSHNYELCFLYIFVFIPLYILAICRWKKNTTNDNNANLTPSFLTFQQKLISSSLLALLFISSYLISTFFIYKDFILENTVIKVLSAIQIATSLGANYWMAYKKVNAWIYWVVFSVAGLIFSCLQTNIFSIALFVVFLVVNSLALRNWIKIVKDSSNAQK